MRYDNRLGDAFWAVGGYLEYFLSMMSSWAIVCDVWYLPPIYREVYFLPCCTFIPFYSLMLWHRHRLPLVPTYAWKRSIYHFRANFFLSFFGTKNYNIRFYLHIFHSDKKFHFFAKSCYPSMISMFSWLTVFLSLATYHFGRMFTMPNVYAQYT